MLVGNVYCHIEMRDVLRWISCLHLSGTGRKKIIYSSYSWQCFLAECTPAVTAKDPGHRTYEHSSKGCQEFCLKHLYGTRQGLGNSLGSSPFLGKDSYLSILPSGFKMKMCSVGAKETIRSFSCFQNKDCIVM